MRTAIDTGLHRNGNKEDLLKEANQKVTGEGSWGTKDKQTSLKINSINSENKKTKKQMKSALFDASVNTTKACLMRQSSYKWLN